MEPLPPAIYVWLVRSEEVLDQPGSWRIRKWDTESFPEANFVAKEAADDIADTLKVLRAKSANLSEFADWILNYWALDQDEHRFQVHARVFKGMDIEGYVRDALERHTATERDGK